jgi:hypothetical protein
LTATVIDDSHNHVISNVDGLQTSLDDLAALANSKLASTDNAVSATSAASATKLTTARSISGAIFDGTANVTIPYTGLSDLPSIPSPLAYDSAHSHAMPGYQKFSNGLIIQWGSASGYGGNYISQTFPIPFTSSVFFVMTHSNSYISSSAYYTLTDFKWECIASSDKTCGVTWIAIGV